MAWIIVILFRLIVPLYILRSPLLGSILAIIADNLDVVILDTLGTKDFGAYNQVDKILDTYFYLIQGYTLLSWKNNLARKTGMFLLGYRIIGVIIYEITHARILLFIFPNVFIFFYMFYLIYKAIFKKEPFTTLPRMVPYLAILTLFKLGHEYLLHVVQFPIYATLREFFAKSVGH